jgi:hypothetical protein
MIHFPSWLDIPDQAELTNRGNCILSRIRFQLKPIIASNAFSAGSISSIEYRLIKNKETIALGICAFLFIGLPNEKSYYQFYKLHNTILDIDFLEKYYSFRYTSNYNNFYKDELSFVDPEIFCSEFLLTHLNEEKNYILKSEKFFYETENETDRIIKLKIQEYAAKYLHFLQDKINRKSVDVLESITPTLTSDFSESNFKTDSYKDSELLKINNETNTPKKSKIDKQTLKEIWNGPIDEFDRVFLKLTTDIYQSFEIPFVTKSGELYYWNVSLTSSKSYLWGFIYTCIINKWILDQYKSPEYKIIIQNTFNISVDSTPYKAAYSLAILANESNNKYLYPFKKYKQ